MKWSTPAQAEASCAPNLEAVLAPSRASGRTALDLLPVPFESRPGRGRLALDSGLTVAIIGADDGRIERGLTRLARNWRRRTGRSIPLHTASDPASATLVIEAAALGPGIPSLRDNEHHTLEITSARAVLCAPTVVGVLRGLQTLEQLLIADDSEPCLPAVQIRDHPRFPWRGLLIDVCRHWLPLDVIRRQLDGMALVKLNVLHLHLTDDQGFRIESQRSPLLHECGSDGRYFTPKQIHTIVEHARGLGIRVIPEFDVPGHATSWLAGYPQLGSKRESVKIERRWGVHDRTLDPTNEAVYALLEGFFAEMAPLFPDEYVHIGGDENNGKHWSANAKIQAFIREQRLGDNRGLQAYFNRRVQTILQKHGKRMIGWDEILHPELPPGCSIQSWRGAESLAEAVRQGFTGILSTGYYLDHCQSAAWHYDRDPLPVGLDLTAAEKKRVLGAEAAMWSEWVGEATAEIRIWPRAAAIAERLWSPRRVSNRDDLYRRLAVISRRLADTGVRHERNRTGWLRRFAGRNASPRAIAALETLIEVIEPLKANRRTKLEPGARQSTPLTGIADFARPESNVARLFSEQVAAYLASPTAAAGSRRPVFAVGYTGRVSNLETRSLQGFRAAPQALLRQFIAWEEAAALVEATWPAKVRIAGFVLQACAIGKMALSSLESGISPARAWFRASRIKLSPPAKSPCEFAPLPAISALLEAACARSDGGARCP